MRSTPACDVLIAMRLVKYLNNIGEQDRRAFKPEAKPVLGFKSFQTAAQVIASVELIHVF